MVDCFRTVNILQISSAASFGGGERYVVDLTNALVARGHDVYVAVRPGSPLPSHLQLSPEKILTLPLRNALDVQSARALEKFVRRKAIDVVHAHLARDYTLASYAARRNRQTKFIATRHVLFKLNRLHRHTLSRATRVIAVSQAVARELRASQVVSDGQIAVIYNGIDVDRVKRTCAALPLGLFLNSIGIPGGGPLVGSIGELRTLKRHDDFIRAAALVLKEFPETQFVLAGVGEARKQLEGLVAELGLSDHFQFLGWLDDADKLLCAMDVFVSASETESFGLAIVEAMAAETAVVATATEGAKEIIDDQQTGLLVPIGDVKAIAAAVTILLSDSDRRLEIAMRAGEAAHQRFSLRRMVDEIERIYLAAD
jgi:glycosyltransferase involved in cell wall biosynthesis